MAGKRKCFVGNIRTQLTDYQLLDALFIHCIIHQQALCAKVSDITCKLKPIVSAVKFISLHAANFKARLGSGFCNLLYYTAVDGRAAVTSCFVFVNSEVTSIFFSAKTIELMHLSGSFLAVKFVNFGCPHIPHE